MFVLNVDFKCFQRKKNENPSEVNKPVETDESVAAVQDEKLSEVQVDIKFYYFQL